MQGNALLKKSHAIARYRTIIIFVSKVLILYLGFLFIKFIHRSLIEPENSYAVSSFLRNFNAYSFFADTIIYPSKWILSLFGYDVRTGERTIFITGSGGLVIHAPCLGFNILSIFISLIIAYPGKAKWAAKALFILIGILLIHLLNVLRISILTLTSKYHNEILIDHHNIYNFIIYFFICVAFYVWIKYYSNGEVKGSAGNINGSRSGDKL